MKEVMDMNSITKLYIQKEVFTDVLYRIKETVEVSSYDNAEFDSLDDLYKWCNHCIDKIEKEIHSIDSYEELKNKLRNEHGWDKFPAISIERN